MKNQLAAIALLFCLTACSPTAKISVTNLHDLANYQANSMIYALPRTRLAIELEIFHHHTVPGPYYAYAEKYLGIKGAPSVSTQTFELGTVRLHPFREADPDYYYSLTSSIPSVDLSRFYTFCDAGLLLDNQNFLSFSEYRPADTEDTDIIYFTDLSVKKKVISGNGKAMKQKDSNLVPTDLPVTKSKEQKRSTEDMAKAASDFIIKIRKRRFKLMAGQYDVFPEGTALETAIRELNALEEEYLSLFIGKTYTDTLKQTYFYAPQAAQDLERTVICRISEETGFEDPGSTAGKPLVLELKSLGNTDALKDIAFPQAGPVYEDVIFYRLPEKALIRLFYGSKIVIEAEEPVYQYGPLVPYSLSLEK